MFVAGLSNRTIEHVEMNVGRLMMSDVCF